MSQVPDEHRRQSPQAVRCAVITVSDSRTTDTDTGGETIVDLLTQAGHSVVERCIIPDEPQQLEDLLLRVGSRDDVQVILMTGGTGISGRDRTTEVVADLLTKSLPGYGELFRSLSYQEIGPAAMLSRAMGGVMGQTVLLTMPGSQAGVRLAMEKLILPEIGHLVREATR
jgi:molybdenum cofactor biosynthesis protein B